jgi:hypothetical protein
MLPIRMRLGLLRLLDHQREPRSMRMHMAAWFKQLTVAMKHSTLADAMREVAAAKTAKATLSDGLFEEVDNLPGFEIQHKSMHYAYLVANPDIARLFMNLSLFYKVSWVTRFVDEKF